MGESVKAIKAEIKTADQIITNALIEIEDISGKIDDDDTRDQFLAQLIEYKYFTEMKKSSKKEEKTEVKVYKFCPNDGFKNDNSFTFCPECGNSLKLG